MASSGSVDKTTSETRESPAGARARRRSPSPAELADAADREVPDLIAADLRVLFCGINPSLYSAALQCHFGRPGNRFWPVLHRAGFTPRTLRPDEGDRLIAAGLGITNVVPRATARAAELSRDELAAGGEALRARIRRFRPRCLAILGITAYRQAFSRPKAILGRQPERLEGAALWVLPNPSGLNAHYQLPALARLYRELANACPP